MIEEKFTAVIVDDEVGARNVLSKLLQKFCPEVEIMALCEDVVSAKKEIDKHQPDLVFLDIEMPQYSGYEIVDFFDDIQFDIIFVTAYESYAIKAFEVCAFDYLLKPVDVSRLKQSIQRYSKKNEYRMLQKQTELLKENLQKGSIQKIILRRQNDNIVVAVEDVIAIEAQQAYCHIHTADRTYTASKNLKYYQNLFSENPAFFRSHKSWIVNKRHIIEFSKSKMEIRLSEDYTAKLSKYKTSEFEKFLTK